MHHFSWAHLWSSDSHFPVHQQGLRILPLPCLLLLKLYPFQVTLMNTDRGTLMSGKLGGQLPNWAFLFFFFSPHWSIWHFAARFTSLKYFHRGKQTRSDLVSLISLWWNFGATPQLHWASNSPVSHGHEHPYHPYLKELLKEPNEAGSASKISWKHTASFRYKLL